ncbi:nitroreductase [Mycobacteroides chelonae]|uniref:nitroreductase family protein n=1 Tax=Mycobacteroides chelonae TaxID=1774 RepID=UPI0008AA2324|nr:nitroreductase family protein [Mycobacteroides chelonae]PKQ59056.1 nitroreductase [Mycobacterium sp. MHSD3]SKL46531.1 Putative nitroreductase family protein [Mycobacteroides abscessus subsp. bolletii]AYM40485.1 nitroreductase [[Mycobacterium] chelonae subsp. gwanakae]MBF9519670.1 nitroreductase [Mycobacteroides chelonae]OHU16069.1 nitroreductase [Mycobacteroides chelonae]
MGNPTERTAITSVPIQPLIASRWSPRHFDPGANLAPETLTALLEAGRWAASWGKRFPVRYIVGLRGDATYEALVELLNRGNSYAKVAAALVLVSTDLGDDDNTAVYAAVDAGLAIAQLGVEARSHGLHTHPMAGFRADDAPGVFGIPENVRPIAVVAIGPVLEDYAGAEESTVERDHAPRQRPALSDIAFIERWGESFGG